MLQVTFAGSGDAFGSGGRLQACIHVRPQGADSAFLLDCGATSMVALKRQQLEPNDVGTVFVSHLHGDHFGGLPFLVLDGQFSRRTRPLTVVGPPGTGRRLADAMELLYPGSSTVRRRFTVDTVELTPGGRADVGGVSAVAWAADHPSGAPALMLRVDAGGTSIGYTGDTAWTDDVLAAAAGTDLFVAEAYTWEETVPYHLTHAALAEHGGRLDTRRVVVTHMSRDMLAHVEETPFEPSSDGSTLTV